MSGCYGNSKEDRYFEKRLDDYLDRQARLNMTDEEREEEDQLKQALEEEKYERRMNRE